MADFRTMVIVEVLTDSVEPRKYWYAMKVRVKNDEGFELSTICRQLKISQSLNDQFFEAWGWGFLVQKKDY